MNIFETQYNTPHECFPFHQATLNDYEEAIMRGMEIENQEIKDIINNPEHPTFDNTIAALERTGELVGRASGIFFNLLDCATTDAMDELSEKLSPIMSEHANNICFNEKLFKRVEQVYTEFSTPDSTLGVEEKKLLSETYKGFIRCGVNLPKERQKRLKEIDKQMDLLELRFSQNKRKEMNAFILHVTEEADLEGLPESSIAAARQAAQEKHLEGWVFTLHAPSMTPFMSYSSRRELRKQMFMAYNTICTHDNKYNNTDIVRQIVNLSLEQAQILGYKCYADFVLEERMAKTSKAVYNLLYDLLRAYKPVAQKEYSKLQELAKEPLEPWDISYYSNQLRQREYQIHSEMLRPYFELEKVKNGVFGLATRLYGITFKLNKTIPVYNEDVDALEVFDKDGSFLAVLYCDFFPRSDKRSGAWMTEFKGQWIDKDGNNSRPHVSLVMNFTRPTADKPALLTHGEVETFLHEFGHALHAIFANTTYEELSGTNVAWDFVELPSQFMENYAVEPEFLNSFAVHYQTGESLPAEYIERILRSRNFNVGLDCLRQLRFGLLDMAYYTLTEPFSEDIRTFEKQSWSDAVILPDVEDTCMSVQFSHIMAGGYAAGYYSYKWAEVMDADAYSLFQERGIFNEEVAQQFREQLLSRGGTEEPEILYERFRGRPATIDALLRRTGLQKE